MVTRRDGLRFGLDFAKPAARRLRPVSTAIVTLSVLGVVACDLLGPPDPVLNTDLGIEVYAPETVGMSSDRLDALTAMIRDSVDHGVLAGATTMLVRQGRVVHFETYGMRDREAGDSMPADAIFRIMSMTKPIVGVALMTLYDDGRFQLSDPVAKYIPEFADLRVWAGAGPRGPILVDADHPMTIRELMTHTSGLTYGIFSDSPVDSMYLAVDIFDRQSSLEDMIGKLSELPLWGQPGAEWHYSVAVDVQAYLIELLSGQRLDTFFRQRIFEPLGMVDTGFHVPMSKAHRFTRAYYYDPAGGLFAGERYLRDTYEGWFAPNPLLSGGGGLVSTALDYMRFCQMLLNSGELDGIRVLSPASVALMRSPQTHVFGGPDYSFGLDFALVLASGEYDARSEGSYYWSGIAGTWFWIDPKEDLAFVGMMQRWSYWPARTLSIQYVYEAITEGAN